VSSFLTHSQRSILLSRFTRRINTYHGRPQSYSLPSHERRVFDLIMEEMDEMHRDGLMIPGSRPEQMKKAAQP
jgi:hypothetical protein